MNHQEVAHNWAHDNYNRNGEINGSRMFAEKRDRAIYSHGRHFCIARKTGNLVFPVLITNRNYSSSTGKHTTTVCNAVRHLNKFSCENPENHVAVIYGEELLSLGGRVADIDHLAEAENALSGRIDKRAVKRLPASENLAGRLAQAKSATAVARLELRDRAEELERFRTSFKIPLKECSTQAKGIRRKFASGKWGSISKDARKRAARELKATRKRQEELRSIHREREAETLEQWIKGDDVRLYHQNGGYARLRVIEGDGSVSVVQTTQGAIIPARDAWKLWIVVQRCRRNKTEFRPNGEALMLGVFPLDVVTPDGNVVVGCHRVQYEEMDRISDEVESAVSRDREGAE